MDFFKEDFKNKLYETIEEIENNSLVEVVAIIRQQSEKYRDVGLIVASIFTALFYSVLIFIPSEINSYLIYLSTLLFFLFVYFIYMGIPFLHRIFISEKRINKSVELLSRAIFQKGGMRFTEQKIGVLFFVSIFEKKVVILPDRGAKMSVPQIEWDKLQTQFDDIFNSQELAENFLKVLSSTKEIFARYIPPVEDDINELPDNLKVDL